MHTILALISSGVFCLYPPLQNTLLIIHTFKYICTGDLLSTSTILHYWQVNSTGDCWKINALLNVSLMAVAEMGGFSSFTSIIQIFQPVPLP